VGYHSSALFVEVEIEEESIYGICILASYTK
jgi:hypothetical protein